MCQDCLLKEMGAGQTTCKKHGNVQIDWKCMFCCSTALFCCFGTHYFCNDCHEEYCNNGCVVKLKDCHGINCPLGIAHPPACADPKKGGVFPLGCGICRSEKLEKLKNCTIKQVVDAENLPKAFIYKKLNWVDDDYGDEYGDEEGEGEREREEEQEPPEIVRPDFEIEIPEFINNPDAFEAILRAEDAAEHARKEQERLNAEQPRGYFNLAYALRQRRQRRRRI